MKFLIFESLRGYVEYENLLKGLLKFVLTLNIEMIDAFIHSSGSHRWIIDADRPAYTA